ncbi:MAG TPA: SDR family NAD(P)-dependent oxidoreductase, partial [Deltaproteobacteria bacterium]|nr:SDR family NAD(P)-dependent oxidoreductase [Deltaproteobacteria bacterium]
MGAGYADVLGQPVHPASRGLGLPSPYAAGRAGLDPRGPTTVAMSDGISLEAAGAEDPMGGYAERYGPWALIAGGSEGIGLSFARRLAARGIHLVLLARRRKPLEEAASLLREEYGVEVRVHAVDLSARDLDRLLDDILHGLEIGLLIYNAGATHGAGLFLDAPLDAARRLVDLNCHGPLVLCHRLGRSMRERGRGGIILLG